MSRAAAPTTPQAQAGAGPNEGALRSLAEELLRLCLGSDGQLDRVNSDQAARGLHDHLAAQAEVAFTAEIDTVMHRFDANGTEPTVPNVLAALLAARI